LLLNDKIVSKTQKNDPT
jgi:hypothetical protein